MQDKKGFLWFSTSYGVSCFNGKSFSNYTTDNGLSGNIIMSITELSDNSKLINTMSGVDRFFGDSIRPMRVLNGKIPSRVVYSKEFAGKIWLIALNKGYDLFCIENGTIQNVVIRTKKGELARVAKLQVTETKGLILITDKGLFCYKPFAGIQPFLEHIVAEKVSSFIEDKKGRYWIGLTDKLLCVTGTEITSSYHLNFNAGVSELLADSRDNIWACVPQLGIILVQNNIASNITDKLGIKNILINHLLEDREKNIWIATHGDGVYKVSSLGIINYLPETNKLNVYARALHFQGENSIYVGSYGTVSMMTDSSFSRLPVKSLLSTDYIYFIQSKGKKMYIGIPTGIIVKDLTSGQEKFIPSYGALSYLEITQDSTWVGGFQHFGCIVNEKYTLLDIPALRERRINAMAAEKKGIRWVGTDSGLYKLSLGHWDRQNILGLDSSLFVYEVLNDKLDRLWVATQNGLYLRKNNAWYLYTEKEGLSHNKCNAIAEDRHHNIWVGTKNGLNRIDGQTLRITEHPTGLYPHEILSLLFNSKNNLVVGTVNGVAVIKELDNEITTRPPPLYITSLSVAGKRWNYPSDITIDVGAKNILLDFIGLSCSYPDNVEYRYRINNLYSQWNLTKNTSLELSSLGSGSYSFVLQARVNGGKWGDPVSLSISIPTVFWKTKWFIILCIASGIGLLYYFIRRQVLHKEQKRNEAMEIQNKMTHLRQQALGALISPHFIFNCLNSIQHYLNRNDKDQANRYLARFGRLIRLTLEYAQEMYIPLHTELDRINLYLELEKLRCGELLNYRVVVDNPLLNPHILIPNMILQPYVENAIWHGIMPKKTPGNLHIEIKKQNGNDMLIRIEDDGVGIASNQRSHCNDSPHHISFGMDLISERLKLLKMSSTRDYAVKVTDLSSLGPGKPGTMIEIILPLF